MISYINEPDNGKIATQEKEITASREDQNVYPDEGQYLTKVTVNKYPDANGTFTANKKSNAEDMGATNNYRYVDTTKLGQSKTVTVGTSQTTVTPDSGLYLSQVVVNPTPTQEKTVTAGTSAVSVTPDNGKHLSKVTANPTPTQEKTVTAGTSAVSVTPDGGKHLSKVTVNPTPTESKTVTPTINQQTVSPSSGKYLSNVVVKPFVPNNLLYFNHGAGAIDGITVTNGKVYLLVHTDNIQGMTGANIIAVAKYATDLQVSLIHATSTKLTVTFEEAAAYQHWMLLGIS